MYKLFIDFFANTRVRTRNPIWVMHTDLATSKKCNTDLTSQDTVYQCYNHTEKKLAMLFWDFLCGQIINRTL